MGKRIEYIDYAKGLAIVFVVFGHIFFGNNKISIWIYSFHIPLFFIISGYLLNYNVKPLKDSIIKKIKVLLIPYISFSILNIICNYALSNFDMKSIKINIIDTISLGGIATLWFLFALFFGETIFLIGKKSFNKIRYEILFYMIIVSIVFILLKLTHGKTAVALVRGIVALFFINIGYYLYNIINKVQLNFFSILIISIVSFISSMINGKVDLWTLHFNNIFLYVFNSIIGSLNIIFISKKIRTSNILKFFGKNTLIIMATHQIMTQFFLESSLNIKYHKFIILCLVLIIEYPIIKIINKYLSFMLGKTNISLRRNERVKINAR